ncbi:hypothetical protein L873DRAFT_1847559 [Choiromyces venosus 120613-1]|uniref:Myb-like domain-containing protein n=1 Tax=Choiromyces venosus 120613-1 TaxID=1336337 RepID=A0A3N4JG27_9PEZI|nr:hypothetical protein L873DRAFT_1847559 [Choiromyces venosus 120613-1]
MSILGKNTGDWSLEETEKIVSWLEEPINLRQTQKGSGEKKSSWLKSIAALIPTKTESQVTYKFDNLKHAHRDTVHLANSSGWGLDDSNLKDCESSIRASALISVLETSRDPVSKSTYLTETNRLIRSGDEDPPGTETPIVHPYSSSCYISYDK